MFYWPVSGGGFTHKKTQENGILLWTSCGEKIRSRKAGSAMLDLDKAFSFRAKNLWRYFWFNYTRRFDLISSKENWEYLKSFGALNYYYRYPIFIHTGLIGVNILNKLWTIMSRQQKYWNFKLKWSDFTEAQSDPLLVAFLWKLGRKICSEMQQLLTSAFKFLYRIKNYTLDKDTL